MTKWKSVICLSGLLAAHAWGQIPGSVRQGGLSMAISPTFEGQLGCAFDSTMPCTVQLANTGKSCSGFLELDGSFIRYPVELPAGSIKTLQVFVPAGGYSPKGNQIRLLTNAGALTLRGPGASYFENGVIGSLVIGGAPGDAAAWAKSNGSGKGYWVAPENAPGRLTAYDKLNDIVLGEGAERLSDEAVTAIRSYTVRGGVLVLMGGAGSGVLADPRWKSWSAANGLDDPAHVAQLGAKLRGYTGATPSAVKLRLHGEKVEEWFARRAVGDGFVVTLAVNLFDQPLSTWQGRGSFIGKVLARPTTTRPYDPYDPGSQDDLDSTMNVRPPDTATIVGILVLFFIAAVPVNLGILKRKNRMELAWITTPVIAILASALIARQSSDLYAKRSSIAAAGTIYASAGSPDAHVQGQNLIFVSSGRKLDLGLKNVEFLGPVQGYRYEGPFGRPSGPKIEAVDVGEILANKVDLPNLGLVDFRFDQRVDLSGWLTVSKTQQKGKPALKIRNDSPYSMNQVYVDQGEGRTMLGNLSSGQEAVAVIAPNSSRPGSTLPLVLRGDVFGCPFGASVPGLEPVGQRAFHLIYDLSEFDR